MPYQVWYQPLVPVQDQMAGTAVRNAFADGEGLLKSRWELSNQVSAFYGRFAL